MKYYLLCIDCRKNHPDVVIWAEGEVTSNLIALGTCPHGHKTVIGLMHSLFDVLYTSAVRSFLKGFYSESVMSFAASLERTYEMFIRVTMLKEGVSFEAIDDFWKEIKNQSERQYGAFCLQYLKATGKAWKIDSKQVSFRNKIIHKGYIATSEEVRCYAEYITSCQGNILSILKEKYKEDCTKLYFHQKESVSDSTKKMMQDNNAKFVASGNVSLLGWNIDDLTKVTFEEAIETWLEISAKLSWD